MTNSQGQKVQQQGVEGTEKTREGVGHKIDVLDHGFIRLVNHMGSDIDIVRAARTSYDAAWRAGEDEGSDIKLINYLWKHRHTTPFEHVTCTFEVKAPILVIRQWHRHRTQSYSELSARYRELPDEVYMPDFRAQSKNNKQGSDGYISDSIAKSLKIEFEHLYKSAFDVYKLALSHGVSREVARSVLPVATYTHMFTTGNLLNFMKFLTLRHDPHAQYEIRVYADAMIELLKKVAPVAMGTWGRNG